ncbi:hypothetical protein [Zavarzinella formosa]|uniref:hypothetical protein n=1 Tax=Zavarzinella formosa TaxID=360055 RepID=UPI0002D72171|nr:hypothetical protein [Zavarzinella formosa]
MSRFKKFLAAAGGVMLAASVAPAQSPVFGEPSLGFPNGKVVSAGPSLGGNPPAALTPPVSATTLPVMSAMPVPGQPTYTTGPTPGTAMMSGPISESQLTVPPSTTGLVPGAVPGTWVQSPLMANATDCCGPVGAHGPIGWETYIRSGPSIPFGRGLLADAMNTGWMTSIGSKSLFFDRDGTAAWVLDPHLTMTYNNGGPDKLGFLRRVGTSGRNGVEDIVTVRNVLRYSVGLGGGRDWYSNLPGFVGGRWDAFYSYGVDGGGRWGTGHVDYQPITDPDGYRRVHDVFGQTYVGAHYNLNIPMGGWTFVTGGRVEVGYTFSDLYPTGGSFWEVNFLFNVGVRY